MTTRRPSTRRSHAPLAPMPAIVVEALPVDDIEPDPLNRQHDPATLPELADSIRTQGLIHAIVVRPLVSPARAKFQIIAGERRWRATKLAGFSSINASVRDVTTDREIREIQLTENIQHETLHPLDEAAAYQTLLDLDPAYTIESVALRVGKPKRHVYQRLTYNRLIPAARNAFRTNALTPAHAERLARLPSARQEEGLRRCFLPILSSSSSPDELNASALAPLKELDTWIDATVRLDFRSEDTKEFLPQLADQITETESQAGATVLALSTHHYHVKTDNSGEPKPILRQGWRHAEDDERCKHAQRGVIVFGEGRGTVLHVCIAKQKCKKHWGDAARRKSSPPDRAAEAAAQAQRLAAQLARQRTRHWRTEHYLPALLKAIATRTRKRKLTTELLVRAVGLDAECLELFVGPIDQLTADQYAQVCIMAMALELRQDWDEAKLDALAREFGIDTRQLRKTLLRSYPVNKIVLPQHAAAA